MPECDFDSPSPAGFTLRAASRSTPQFPLLGVHGLSKFAALAPAEAPLRAVLLHWLFLASPRSIFSIRRYFLIAPGFGDFTIPQNLPSSITRCFNQRFPWESYHHPLKSIVETSLNEVALRASVILPPSKALRLRRFSTKPAFSKDPLKAALTRGLPMPSLIDLL
jgi:hypothetical protein